MPLFDYRCGDCGHSQEHLVRVSHVCGDLRCPKCGMREGPTEGYNRTVSAPSQFNLKGSGWYKPGAS